ncbi:hypothetical protein GCM10009022_24260 [Vreelandella titanicae]
MNDQEVRALVKTVDRADFHTVGVFALDAVLGNDKRHLAIPLAGPGNSQPWSIVNGYKSAVFYKLKV